MLHIICALLFSSNYIVGVFVNLMKGKCVDSLYAIRIYKLLSKFSVCFRVMIV